jgi:flagellar basal body-associated protein FliL
MSPETKISEKIEKNAANSAPKSSNKTLFWILGGCLAILIISGLVVAGFSWWGYKKVKNEIKTRQAGIEELQKQMEKMKSDVSAMPESAKENFQEEPAAEQPASVEGMTPFPTEKQIGYIKKVYVKNGKNYLDIDYIQWMAGDAAEKAMREDGECPKTGECIVYDDYYIRNQNPLIRTFEISPDVKIVMQTYDAEQAGIIGNNQEITFDQLKNIFSSGSDLNSHLKDVPYIVEISNQQIIKITEQYIP